MIELGREEMKEETDMAETETEIGEIREIEQTEEEEIVTEERGTGNKRPLAELSKMTC